MPVQNAQFNLYQLINNEKKISWNNIKPETQSVWGGEIEAFPHGATQTPTVNSVAYGYDNLDEWMQVAKGEKDGHIYGRNTNPTVNVLEEKIRILEGAEAATIDFLYHIMTGNI